MMPCKTTTTYEEEGHHASAKLRLACVTRSSKIWSLAAAASLLTLQHNQHWVQWHAQSHAGTPVQLATESLRMPTKAPDNKTFLHGSLKWKKGWNTCACTYCLQSVTCANTTCNNFSLQGAAGQVHLSDRSQPNLAAKSIVQLFVQLWNDYLQCFSNA